MSYSTARQSPVTALATMFVLTLAGYARRAVAPYGNEIAGTLCKAPVAAWLSVFEHANPVWATILAVLVTLTAGVVTGLACNRFRLYSVHCFLSMPLYAVAACGIFIAAEPLTAALMSLLTALALKYMGRGYLRGQDLTAMLYAGLCIGTMPLLSAPAGVALWVLIPAAVAMLSLSLRELSVLVFSMLLAPAAVCYGVWAFGGDFLAPVASIAEALTAPSYIPTFGYDDAGALLICGLLGYTAVCAMAIFAVNRFSVSLKSRGIHIYIMVALAVTAGACALPSSTPAMLGVAAVPLSMIMPVMYVNIGARWSLILYLSVMVAFAAHLALW